MYMPPTPGNQSSQPPVVQINNQPRKEGAGPIIGAIIVVILLVFGALYFWGQKLNNDEQKNLPLVQGQITL
jgi:hypothetical protein